ncbi:lipase member H-B isoform X2 [Drosophila navojoa]|uniref:lipase member H-B isoform X2 n=1 Tax=Drosophila navojoa TaxID=7232 RepID=UPI0008471454|nr:lipase member H-B isoform X2 [Drosophila navojoa]
MSGGKPSGPIYRLRFASRGIYWRRRKRQEKQHLSYHDSGWLWACLLPLLLLLLLGNIRGSGAHLHKWDVLKKSFRYMQETMLSNSLERAHLNYGIVFECRTISDASLGDEVHFHLQLGDLRGFRRLDARKKLALFLHGWNDQGSKDWVQELLLTWTLFDEDYNVCVVDWGNLSQNDYKSASMSIFDVGLTVAGIIIALEEMRPQHFHRQNVTLAGYSLGAHAAGYAGAVLGGQVEQIIGLDPAGPLFTLPADVHPKYRLDKTDAKFVQVLHTSGGTLGTSLKCGHADFYPNGGRAPQSNCLMFMNLRDMQNTNPIACSHSAAAIFFRQSMDPQYPFIGYECESYRAYRAGYCDNNRRAIFGIHSQRWIQGSFYFDTSSSHPYVQRQRPQRRWNWIWDRPRNRNRNRISARHLAEDEAITLTATAPPTAAAPLGHSPQWTRRWRRRSRERHRCPSR